MNGNERSPPSTVRAQQPCEQRNRPSERASVGVTSQQYTYVRIYI